MSSPSPMPSTCDMGGTSLDVALVTQGEALRRTRGRLVGHWTAMSMVDVDSVGSGGGSIAWVDSVGALRVGPQSAGADPGPACYGHGGDAATVTDALVVLGYIDPANFLGGRMVLDADAARLACERLGARLHLGTAETAWGIRAVALTMTAKAVRARLASRGLPAAGLALIAYGGCGPLFGADIAAAVGRDVLPCRNWRACSRPTAPPPRRFVGSGPVLSPRPCRSTAGFSARSAPRCGRALAPISSPTESPRGLLVGTRGRPAVRASELGARHPVAG